MQWEILEKIEIPVELYKAIKNGLKILKYKLK